MPVEMDVHPARFEFDFEDLKDTEGYKQPEDFLVRVLPLDAGGALPGRGKTKEKLWYEYPDPFGEDWNLQSNQLELLELEEREREELEELEKQREQLEADMHRQSLLESEQQHQKKRRRQKKKRQRQRQRQRQLEESLSLNLEESLSLNLEESLSLSLEERQWQQRLVETKQQGQYNEESHLGTMRRGWGPDHETPTYSSSPARDAPEEHQFDVEEDEFCLEENQVLVRMWENDGADIPRYRLFKSEANTEKLLLASPLKIPYYIYAGRCNLNLEGYELRYADLFPNFGDWTCSWVRPTTYEGDDQYVDFWSELMREVEYSITKDQVLAKAIAIANRGFRKMLYFQIEIAVLDCMMLLEHKEKMAQTCDLYGNLACEIYFKGEKYESVLQRRMDNPEEVLRYKLTAIGSDADEDDAWEMREFVNYLVKHTPVELPHARSFDDEYANWVYKKITLKSKRDFHLYVNYLVKKLNMAQDLKLA